MLNYHVKCERRYVTSVTDLKKAFLTFEIYIKIMAADLFNLSNKKNCSKIIMTTINLKLISLTKITIR